MVAHEVVTDGRETYDVEHGLDLAFPFIEVYDEAGCEVWGAVDAIVDRNTCRFKFPDEGVFRVIISR